MKKKLTVRFRYIDANTGKVYDKPTKEMEQRLYESLTKKVNAG